LGISRIQHLQLLLVQHSRDLLYVAFNRDEFSPFNHRRKSVANMQSRAILLMSLGILWSVAPIASQNPPAANPPATAASGSPAAKVGLFVNPKNNQSPQQQAAAGGAAGGAAIGAIAGDAGTGAAVGATAGAVRGRRQQKKANKQAEQQAAQQGQAQQQQTLDTFRRAFSSCIDAKGYSVK
jgi:hypothetical protein